MAVTLAEVGAVPSALAAGRVSDGLVGVGVCGVWLFGSVARGESTEDSDINLVATCVDLDHAWRYGPRARVGPAGRTGGGLASRCDGHRPTRAGGALVAAIASESEESALLGVYTAEWVGGLAVALLALNLFGIINHISRIAWLIRYQTRLIKDGSPASKR